LSKYRQITSGERYVIQALRRRRLSVSAIAQHLGRAPSTISREIRRNLSSQGRYTPFKADQQTRARRSRSRCGARFTADDWVLVDYLITLDWSPEQVAGWLALEGELSISHETIYIRLWRDKEAGGDLWRHLRQATKRRRKRYRSHDSRGRLAGKRHISERPAEVEGRGVIGHWEIDTVKGDSHGSHTVVTMVERVTGFTLIGKLARHCAAETTARVTELISRHAGSVLTITADNGSEFHGYRDIEAATGVPFYFATPHHSWERGTNENTNGLIRQYLPKRESMAHVTQQHCDSIAARLNSRPRKRHGFRTPEEMLCRNQGDAGVRLSPNVALQT
jgi:IS30 family transposase